MEEMNDELNITGTNLLSSVDMLIYLWKKCDKFSPSFKPVEAKNINVNVISKEEIKYENIISTLNISKTDFKKMDLKKGVSYSLDVIEFETTNDDKKVISKGTIKAIYKSSLWTFNYYISENDSLKLICKSCQKRKLFSSFPTEDIQFF